MIIFSWAKTEAPRTHAALRWKNVVLIAFGQKKMFCKSCSRNPAFVYLCCLSVYSIGIIRDPGRWLVSYAPYIFTCFGWIFILFDILIEFLSGGCIHCHDCILWRRNVLKLKIPVCRNDFMATYRCQFNSLP